MDLTPDKVSYGSSLVVWWLCQVCGSEYDKCIKEKTIRGDRCPYCANVKVNHTNRLTTTHNEISKEWDYAKNKGLTPDEVTYGSNEKVWWKCSFEDCGHEYLMVIKNRTIQNQGCTECKRRKSSERNKGQGHPGWKGGITELTIYLRLQLDDWKYRSAKQYNNKCYISGKKKGKLEVHHTKPFNVIRDELLKELKLPVYKKIGEYSQKELDLLVKRLLEEHDKHLGITIREDIHDLFHKLYGWDEDVTLDDLMEFKERYLSGEFNELNQ